MTDIIALTAAQAAAAVERGELDRRELFEAYRERAAADELNAYLWVADEPRPCLPREVALAQAPDVADGGFRVPSPTA